MSITLYEASVPALNRMLRSLGHLLQQGALHAQREGLRPGALLEKRLAPDMFPLARQVEIVVSGAKGCGARLSGRLAPEDTSWELAVFNRGDTASFGPLPTSFEQLQGLVEEALVQLRSLSPGEIAAGPTSISVAKRGEVRHFETHSFVLDYVLPNLYFHVTVVYALLRAAGVPLGKKDFEGAPAYRLQVTPLRQD
ncbi:hypothetical protein MYSTI_05858 [Myxococcus stipitatus DSM 14675]|uniref:DUF1993 domain-containing protein n=1 Tax=Myxococcus stipitatus (strain DSM 14675 / JCM 12634 / Mx s8) TaxID=1278073 RepID=L7UL10_MYXSD|nr:DUF1993 domain-containing protein [Myxococcus stipitatus]AGC47134.1 hypothetical protein MYSTI_05858 [Myxococcus stipitatus DSM 14675]